MRRRSQTCSRKAILLGHWFSLRAHFNVRVCWEIKYRPVYRNAVWRRRIVPNRPVGPRTLQQYTELRSTHQVRADCKYRCCLLGACMQVFRVRVERDQGGMQQQAYATTPEAAEAVALRQHAIQRKGTYVCILHLLGWPLSLRSAIVRSSKCQCPLIPKRSLVPSRATDHDRVVLCARPRSRAWSTYL